MYNLIAMNFISLVHDFFMAKQYTTHLSFQTFTKSQFKMRKNYTQILLLGPILINTSTTTVTTSTPTTTNNDVH